MTSRIPSLPQLRIEPYRNLSGDSGVTGYALARHAIAVRFTNGEIYLYTHASAGAGHIAAMLTLAQAGQGLSGYIAQHVRTRYERKL